MAQQGQTDPGTGTDPAYVPDREVFDAYTHQQIWDLVHEKLAPAELADLAGAWGRSANALEAAFDDFARELTRHSGDWSGLAAATAARAAAALVRAGDDSVAVCRVVEQLVVADSRAAEAVRAAIPPPLPPYLPDPDPAVEAATGAGRRTTYNTTAATLAADARDAMTFRYNPAIPVSGDNVPRFPTAASLEATGTSAVTDLPKKPDGPGAPDRDERQPPPGQPGATAPDAAEAAPGDDVPGRANTEPEVRGADSQPLSGPAAQPAGHHLGPDGADPSDASPSPHPAGFPASATPETPRAPEIAGSVEPGRTGTSSPSAATGTAATGAHAADPPATTPATGGSATATPASASVPERCGPVPGASIPRPAPGVALGPSGAATGYPAVAPQPVSAASPPAVTRTDAEPAVSRVPGNSPGTARALPAPASGAPHEQLAVAGTVPEASSELLGSAGTVGGHPVPAPPRELSGTAGTVPPEAAAPAEQPAPRPPRLLPAGVPLAASSGAPAARDPGRERSSPDYLHAPNHDLTEIPSHAPPVLGEYPDAEQRDATEPGGEKA
ncbi:hypothetical protein [Nocardia sp. X0981]